MTGMWLCSLGLSIRKRTTAVGASPSTARQSVTDSGSRVDQGEQRWLCPKVLKERYQSKMDARTLEVLHKRRYPGSLLTGARLKEINEVILALPEPTFRKLLTDIRDGVTESISLYQNEFDVESFALFVEVMKNQPALLVNIDLGRNCLSAEMGVLLAATLPCLTRLESLSLDYNMLGDVGITAIASAVKSHKTLRTLRVRCNQIGEPGFDTLVQAVLASKTLGTLELGVRLPPFVQAHLDSNKAANANVKTKPFKVDGPVLRNPARNKAKETSVASGTASDTASIRSEVSISSPSPSVPEVTGEMKLKSEGVKPLALVVSNADYATNHLRALKGYRTWERADEVSGALTANGFIVDRKKDLNQREMSEVIGSFISQTGPDTIAILYYSGHGCEALRKDGELDNYLIPVDERGVTDYHLQHTAVSVTRIMEAFGRQRCGIVLIVLDVCVAYPVSRHEPAESSSKGCMGNLVVLPDYVQEGMFVITPSQPRTTPPGGVGDNGTFHRHMLRHIVNQGLDLRGLLRRVQRGVSDETKGAMVPFTAFYTLSPDPLYLRPHEPQLCEDSALATFFTDSLPSVESDDVTALLGAPPAVL